MSKLQSSRPFSGVGLVLVIPQGCISISVTFEMHENFRTESVLFNIVEVSLPFNVILGRPTLYQFMAVTHYGYLVLKMSSPNDVLKIRGDRDAGVSALEKLQALAAQHEAAVGPGSPDQAPSSHASMAHHQHPVCSPLAKRTSP
jgi:hypothetical protein